MRSTKFCLRNRVRQALDEVLLLPNCAGVRDVRIGYGDYHEPQHSDAGTARRERDPGGSVVRDPGYLDRNEVDPPTGIVDVTAGPFRNPRRLGGPQRRHQDAGLAWTGIRRVTRKGPWETSQRGVRTADEKATEGATSRHDLRELRLYRLVQ